jgi:hypothetical protein
MQWSSGLRRGERVNMSEGRGRAHDLIGGGFPALEAASKIEQRAAQIAAWSLGGGDCMVPSRQEMMLFWMVMSS